MLQSKIFANGSTTLPEPVRDALGIKAGDRVRYVISRDSVQVLRTRSAHELAGMLARDEQATIILSDMENAIIEGAVESGKITTDPTKPDGTMRKLMDVGRLAQMGWSAGIQLEQSLADTYAWYLANIATVRA